MALNLVNLDERTRSIMLEEIESDISSSKLYISPRLNSRGLQEYPRLLKESATNHDDAWLAERLRRDGLMKTQEERRKPKGGYTIAQVPVTAPDTLAEGEFNRFYIRGLCLRAIQDGIPELVVYRAKQVSSPRRESEAKIGAMIPPQSLLQDVRTHPGVDTALGLPPCPNSGLSVRLP
ncbi:MAG TPA: hypothetical protein VF543_16275 [Pyrinomonadaceae bacterium]|jgi:hypothetical protein